jgi:hypothetical protein
MQEIPQDARIVRDPDFYRIFNCPHRGQGMGVGSNPAGALCKMMGIPGITTLKDDFETSEHGA